MYKSAFAVTFLLTVCCLCFDAAQSQTCSQLEKMVECFADIRKYMDRPVNVTVVINLAGGDQSMLKRCENLNQFITCLDEKMRDCRVVTDAQDQSIVFWTNARRGFSYLCTEQREAFLNHQPCLSSTNTRGAVIACDSADSDSRRKRHTCDDYNREIRCMDTVISSKCGADAARHVGHVARIYLKNTPHTKDCRAPEFEVKSGAAVGVVSFPLLLSACFAAVNSLL